MDEAQFRVDLGERLRKARVAAGLTQRELGLRCEISRPSIANIEVGKQETVATMLVKLAAGCDVTVGYLVGESDVDTTTRLFDAEAALAYLVKTVANRDAEIAWSRARAVLAQLPSETGG